MRNEFDEFYAELLVDSGLTDETKKAYWTDWHQFYAFTGSMHPIQAGTKELIEAFYDSLEDELNTKARKMASLKYLYKKASEIYPACSNPFDRFPKEVLKKLNKTIKENSKPPCLTEQELNDIIKMLKEDDTVIGQQNYGAILLLTRSGLLASEIVSLTWECLIKHEGKLKVVIPGKNKSERLPIQICPHAIEILRKAFIMLENREPNKYERVLQASNTGMGYESEGMVKSTLHRRIKNIAKQAKDKGFIRKDLNVSTKTFRYYYTIDTLAKNVPWKQVNNSLGYTSGGGAIVRFFTDVQVDMNNIYRVRRSNV